MDSLAKTLFSLLIVIISTSAQANYSRTSIRYASGPELFARIYQLHKVSFKFLSENQYSFYSPSQNIDQNDYELCYGISDNNKNILGFNTPTTGLPVYTEPPPVFVAWMNKCSKIWVISDLIGIFKPENTSYEEISTVPESILKRYFGSFTEQYTKGLKPVTLPMGTERRFPTEGLQRKFLDVFSKNDLQNLIKEQIEILIGPSDIIADLGITADSKKLSEKIAQSIVIDSQTKTMDVMIQLRQQIYLTDEFLSY